MFLRGRQNHLIAPGEKSLHQGLRCSDVHIQKHPGCGPRKVTDGAMQAKFGIGVHRVHGAEGQPPDKFAMHIAHRRLKAFDRAEEIERGRMDLLPLSGQEETAAPSLTEPDAQPFLQMPHVDRDGGLAHAQAALGSRKTVAPDDFGKNAQQAQLDVAERPAADGGRGGGHTLKITQVNIKR